PASLREAFPLHSLCSWKGGNSCPPARSPVFSQRMPPLGRKRGGRMGRPRFRRSSNEITQDTARRPLGAGTRDASQSDRGGAQTVGGPPQEAAQRHEVATPARS